MTTITMRYTNGAFLVTGKNIETQKFGSRREAKDWRVKLYPGAPIYEIGADSSKRKTRAMPRKHPGASPPENISGASRRGLLPFCNPSLRLGGKASGQTLTEIGRIPEEATPPTNAMAAECPRRPPSLPPMLDLHCYASAAVGPMLASP